MTLVAADSEKEMEWPVVHAERDAKARYVSAMFARISRRYDFMNTVMTGGRHHAWRRLAVRLADPPSQGTALDVACGTGDFAFELARRPVRKVVGVDFCSEMIALARKKARARAASGGDARVDFEVADALALPFPDGTFDCITIGFGLRNVTSIPACLEEMHRVLRPGGRLANLELTPLRSGRLRGLVRLYMYRVLPLLGRALARDGEAYSYLPNSVTEFPSAEELAEALRDVGFAPVWFRRLALGTVAIHVAEKRAI